MTQTLHDQNARLRDKIFNAAKEVFEKQWGKHVNPIEYQINVQFAVTIEELERLADLVGKKPVISPALIDNYAWLVVSFQPFIPPSKQDVLETRDESASVDDLVKSAAMLGYKFYRLGDFIHRTKDSVMYCAVSEMTD